MQFGKSFCALILFIASDALIPVSAFADVLFMKNGDRISGEIQRVWDDQLYIVSDYADEFAIALDAIARRPIHSLFLPVLLASFLAGCASAFDVQRSESTAFSATEDTSIGREVAMWMGQQRSESGYYPLSSGTDALGARLALIDKAERSIDVQYFLMKQDDAGLLIAASLKKAADRGVRVRLLLDDIFTKFEDSGLLTLSMHENVEVRLFNPINRRGGFALNYLIGFERFNRRMHNKSFIVDNQISVVGGRNIADEYFELKPATDFSDFDMLAIGPISGEAYACI
ncbi:MAG: phospholipase D-like domain-containing protein [Pseudomonadales bacterium]